MSPTTTQTEKPETRPPEKSAKSSTHEKLLRANWDAQRRNGHVTCRAPGAAWKPHRDSSQAKPRYARRLKSLHDDPKQRFRKAVAGLTRAQVFQVRELAHIAAGVRTLARFEEVLEKLAGTHGGRVLNRAFYKMPKDLRAKFAHLGITPSGVFRAGLLAFGVARSHEEADMLATATERVGMEQARRLTEIISRELKGDPTGEALRHVMGISGNDTQQESARRAKVTESNLSQIRKRLDALLLDARE